jgi:hypothetical protein
VISEEPHVNEKLGELHQPREDILQGEENEWPVYRSFQSPSIMFLLS